jgi:hypothetical protein
MTNLIAMMHTTAAYHAAAVQLMAGEANFVASQLGISERVPPQTNEMRICFVQPPPLGVGGTVSSSNYTFNFEKGRFVSFRKKDWLKRLVLQPPSTTPPDSGAALQIATQSLAKLSVDMGQLERIFTRHERYLNAQRLDEQGRNLSGESNKVPLLQFSWGTREPPLDFKNPVRVRLIAATREIIELDLRETNLLRRPSVDLTNTAQLLGALPPPRHFVEELFGGRAAYDVVARAERVDASLLNSFFTQEEAKKPEVRQGPVIVSRKLSQSLAKALLDFETYQWTARKLCSPNYGVKLRFTRGCDTVDVRLCFECDILEITFNGKTRAENFDFNHNELAAIAKKIFPKDAIIQALAKEDEKKARQQMEEQLRSVLSQ